MPARNSLDAFSYLQQQQTADHYTDIETATLARTRQKAAKERGKQQASIWTVPEPEKSNKKAKSNSSSTNKQPKDKSNKKTDQSSSSKGGLELKTFLENPILENELRNWTLPRVELWCRDPNCSFNQRLWGDHYTSQHHQQPQPYSPGVVIRVNSLPLEDDYHQDQRHIYDLEKQSTRSKSSSGYQSNSQQYGNQYHSYHNPHQHSSRQNDISINSVPSSMMVLNTHHSDHHSSSSSGASTKGPHHRVHGNMHMNMSMGMGSGGNNGMNNLNTKKDGSFAGAPKADNNFTNSSVIPQQTKGKMTMTQTDTMASSIATHSSNKTNNMDSNLLTIHTGNGHNHHSHNHHGGGRGDESPSSTATDVSSGSTFVTGFESTGSGSSSKKPVDHDIVEYTTLSRNGPSTGYQSASSGSGYPSLPYSQGFRAASTTTNPYCPNCSGVVPLNHLDTVADVSRLKGDPGFWHFNKFQHPLQRDHSFHSVGGFTLNGQYNTNVKKNTMLKFCSSHKISLVVSTFSLLVTIGLLITLFLMKKRGMMDTMDS